MEITCWDTVIRYIQIFGSPRTRISENSVLCRNSTDLSAITPDSWTDKH